MKTSINKLIIRMLLGTTPCWRHCHIRLVPSHVYRPLACPKRRPQSVPHMQCETSSRKFLCGTIAVFVKAFKARNRFQVTTIGIKFEWNRLIKLFFYKFRQNHLLNKDPRMRPCVATAIRSVSDPDPGSSAFLTPGSGIRIRDPDPGWTTRIIFPSWEFGFKYLNSLMWIRDGKTTFRDPGWKKVGSGINIPDPQHWQLLDDDDDLVTFIACAMAFCDLSVCILSETAWMLARISMNFFT